MRESYAAEQIVKRFSLLHERQLYTISKFANDQWDTNEEPENSFDDEFFAAYHGQLSFAILFCTLNEKRLCCKPERIGCFILINNVVHPAGF